MKNKITDIKIRFLFSYTVFAFIRHKKKTHTAYVQKTTQYEQNIKVKMK